MPKKQSEDNSVPLDRHTQIMLWLVAGFVASGLFTIWASLQGGNYSVSPDYLGVIREISPFLSLAFVAVLVVGSMLEFLALRKRTVFQNNSPVSYFGRWRFWLLSVVAIDLFFAVMVSSKSGSFLVTAFFCSSMPHLDYFFGFRLWNTAKVCLRL